MNARYAGRGVVVLMLGGALATGCDNELGPCQPEAADQLVYGASGMVATKGQALIHDSCGQGAFCHSAAAVDEARLGAPIGMDYEMLPSPTGLSQILTNPEAVWRTVASARMPPVDYAVTDGDWAYSVERAEHSKRLASIATDEGKAAVRNWLACGAPVVTDTNVPAWARPPAPPTEPTWAALYRDLIAPRCVSGCHDAQGAARSGRLDLSAPCLAYAELQVAKDCGEPNVVGGDEQSLLLDKLNEAPRCGTPMPPPQGGVSDDLKTPLRQWIAEGALAPECE